MLIALCSAKGSPGVTTTMVALGACWPEEEPAPILLEADPAGGDLAARFGLTRNPGLVSLATAARHTQDPRSLAAHCQALPGGLRVIPAPADADTAHAALRMLRTGGGGELLDAAAADPDTLVLMDAGRIEPDSPTVALLRGSSAVVILTRPQVEDLAHAATLMAIAPRWTRHPGLVLVGSGYPAVEVQSQLGAPVMAVLPTDPAGVAVLCGRPGMLGVRTSTIGQVAAGLARVLRRYTHPPGSLSTALPPAWVEDEDMAGTVVPRQNRQARTP